MVKRINKTNLYTFLCVISAVSLITANLCAIKNESFFGLTLGGGIVTIVIDYVVSDLVAEVYGLSKALHMRLMAIFGNVLSVALLATVVWLPSADGFTMQNEFASIFSLSPLMLLASMLAFFCGTRVNDWLMSIWHEKNGEKGLFQRCILSTVAGGIVDTVVFTLVAYGLSYSWVDNMENILLTYGLKILVETTVFPIITVHAISWAKKLPVE